MIINENANYSEKDVMPLVEECLAGGMDVRMKVSGISMTPILHNIKDSVVLTKTDRVKKYDIVLYKRANGKYILHRIIGRKKGAFVMAGDFEIEKEYPVYEDMIIAKVTSFCRNGKDYTPEDFVIRLYSVIWVLVFPVRQWILYMLNCIRRIFHGKR